MTSRGGCTDRAARTPRCAAARARTTRRGGGRDGGLGTTSRGSHGRAPAGDPRAAGEEGGGAPGRASRGGLGDVGAAGWGRRRSEFSEGGNLLGWLG